MNDDAQILIARLLTHQALTRKDKLVKRALSDELFRMEIDQRLAACGMKLLDNVYADHVTLALTRDVEPKVFGEREVWTKQQHGAGPRWRGFAGGVVGTDHLPKRERQEAHQHAEQDQNDMFDKEKPLPSAEDASIGISYRALLADFGDKLGKKTRMDMNLGQLSRFGFIERRNDIILEGPLLDLLMDTDTLKERVVNGALQDIFQWAPRPAAVPEVAADSATEAVADTAETAAEDIASPSELT